MSTHTSSTVTGYHGTKKECVETILKDGFLSSHNEYDWLGDGVYFFQDAPKRARSWGQKFFGESCAVIGAEISTEDCMDLLDVEWSNFLADVYDVYLEKHKAENLPLPLQSSGAHRLDREVLNFACSALQAKGIVIKSIRAAFLEGNPIYPNSALYSMSHVQISVRELDVIKQTWLESSSMEVDHG